MGWAGAPRWESDLGSVLVPGVGNGSQVDISCSILLCCFVSYTQGHAWTSAGIMS